MENVKKVAVLGLGFVGLPLALSFALRGAKVIGVDVNQGLVEDLNNGITHHLEAYHNKPIQEVLREQLDAGRFEATADVAYALKECDNIIMTVGIPVIDGEHSYDHVKSASEAIAKGLKQGDLVLVRSTLIPGMTEGYIKPILETSGLKAGEGFYLGYSSERIAEGKAFDEFENMPTLVSGINEESIKKATELLAIVTKAEIVPATDMKVVESAKVMENISRDVNIAMVNEFARFCEKLGIDIFEVIKVANTHKRVQLLYPGPGVGGYCIPNALYYLLPKAEELGVELDLLKTARQINDTVPEVIVELMSQELAKEGIDLKGARIAALGLAMKDFSNDDRYSPAIAVVELLRKRGVLVTAYDPAVPNEYPYKVGTLEEAVQGADAIIILAKQESIPFNSLTSFKEAMAMEHKPVLIDTRNVLDRQSVEGAGFRFAAI